MFIFVLIGGLALVFILLLFIAVKLLTGSSLADRIKEVLNNKIKYFFFNGAIQSYLVAFIKLGVASSIQIIMIVSLSPYVKDGERVSSICIYSFLILSVVGFFIFVRYN